MLGLRRKMLARLRPKLAPCGKPLGPALAGSRHFGTRERCERRPITPPSLDVFAGQDGRPHITDAVRHEDRKWARCVK